MMQMSGSIEEPADEYVEVNELLRNMTVSVRQGYERSINNLSSS